MTTVNVTCNVSPCQVIHEIDLPVFGLTSAEGAEIAGAILAIWALGWGFRMLIKALNSGGNNSESE
jgi:hypothetical protein